MARRVRVGGKERARGDGALAAGTDALVVSRSGEGAKGSQRRTVAVLRQCGPLQSAGPRASWPLSARKLAPKAGSGMRVSGYRGRWSTAVNVIHRINGRGSKRAALGTVLDASPPTAAAGAPPAGRPAEPSGGPRSVCGLPLDEAGHEVLEEAVAFAAGRRLRARRPSLARLCRRRGVLPPPLRGARPHGWGVQGWGGARVGCHRLAVGSMQRHGPAPVGLAKRGGQPGVGKGGRRHLAYAPTTTITAARATAPITMPAMAPPDSPIRPAGS